MSMELLESLIPQGQPESPAAYSDLEEHLIKTFSTFESLNDSFLNGKETSIQDPGVDLDAVRTFYQRLKELPAARTLFISLLRTSEVLLRRPGRPLKGKEDLRFLLIILENPAIAINFSNTFKPNTSSPSKKTSNEARRSSKIPQLPPQSSSQSSTPEKSSSSRPSAPPVKEPQRPNEEPPIRPSTTELDIQHTQHSLMKRLYGIASNLPNELHHYLVNWFARLLAPPIFRRRVEMINSFITYRLGKHQKRASTVGPNAIKAQRQLYTNDWQIKASARMMALFFAANSNRRKIDLSEFYNTLVR
jgi:E3 ubiquitin-protein ligase HECTD2